MADDRTQLIFKALSSEVRREILWKIWHAERAVADIAAGLGIAAPTLSGHLAVLREAGLVDMRAEGTTRWYRARQSAVAGVRGLLDEEGKWDSAQVHAEQRHASSRVHNAVVVSAEAPCSPDDAFRAFTDARLYSAFAGGDVRFDGNKFSAALDIGQVVRGTYLLAQAPALIVMEWDFQVDGVPVPGAAQRAHLIISPAGPGCHLEIVQFIAEPHQADYMSAAWRYILGCFSERIAAILAQDDVAG